MYMCVCVCVFMYYVCINKISQTQLKSHGDEASLFSNCSV